jgi:MSHA biogenesis protein MshK
MTIADSIQWKQYQRPLRRGGIFILLSIGIASPLQLVFADAKELQDPTRPVTYVAVGDEGDGPTSLMVQAIFLRESGNQAVINGQLLQTGDSIAQSRIGKISHNAVQIISGDDIRVISLRSHILTTPELGE